MMLNSKVIKAIATTALLAALPGLMHAEPFDTLGMDLSPEEIEAVQQSMEYGRQISQWAEAKNGSPFRRDAHAKATGCVRATFSVNGDIPRHFQSSVFADPGREYQAWIRFSNGDMLVQADAKPDARGMAIKLLNVEGDKIAPELTGPNTQDFIMTNTPAFFNRNIFDYVADMKYLAEKKRLAWFVSLWPPRLHPRRLYIAAQTVASKINTPLAPQYYSMLPYQLGTTTVKFSARPCPGMQFQEQANKSDHDFLTEAMTDQLSSQSACFEFMLQEKVPGADMPLDDATAVWSEQESPFVPVARIHIPPQTFSSAPQQNFCENLSMNPWHGVGDWQPLGSLSKARRLVYHAVSQYRHQQNGVAVFEPDSWCLASDQHCDPDTAIATTTDTPKLPRCFDSLFQPIAGDKPRGECP